MTSNFKNIVFLKIQWQLTKNTRAVSLISPSGLMEVYLTYKDTKPGLIDLLKAIRTAECGRLRSSGAYTRWPAMFSWCPVWSLHMHGSRDERKQNWKTLPAARTLCSRSSHCDPRNTFKVTDQFVYLGAVLSTDYSADEVVNIRINKCPTDFGRIRERVISSHKLQLTTMAAEHKAICLSVLLYGIEMITMYAKHVKLLELFHVNCIKEILTLTWSDWMMLSRVGIQSIECLLARNHIR